MKKLSLKMVIKVITYLVVLNWLVLVILIEFSLLSFTQLTVNSVIIILCIYYNLEFKRVKNKLKENSINKYFKAYYKNN